MAIKHAFTSGIADGTDTSVVRPSNWNADHIIDSDLDISQYGIGNIGYMAVGNSASLDSDYLLNFVHDWVVTDNDFRFGQYVQARASKTTATFTAYLHAGYFEARLNALNTQNWTRTPVGLAGVHGEVSAFGTNGLTSGTVTGAANFWGTLDLKQYTATFTNLYHIYLSAPSFGSGVQPTSLYGIFIENMSGASTNNYAIYTNGGYHQFGGNTKIVGDLTLGGGGVGQYLIGNDGFNLLYNGSYYGFYTKGASGSVERLEIGSGVAVVSASWMNCKQVFDANSLPDGDPKAVGQLYYLSATGLVYRSAG